VVSSSAFPSSPLSGRIPLLELPPHVVPLLQTRHLNPVVVLLLPRDLRGFLEKASPPEFCEELERQWRFELETMRAHLQGFVDIFFEIDEDIESSVSGLCDELSVLIPFLVGGPALSIDDLSRWEEFSLSDPQSGEKEKERRVVRVDSKAVVAGLRAELEELRRARVARNEEIREFNAASRAQIEKLATEFAEMRARLPGVDAEPLQVEAWRAALGIVGDVNSRGDGGRTQLHAAAAASDLYRADLLVACGADPRITDAAERTPLHDAAVAGNRQIVSLLIAAGAELGAIDREGATPLHVAAASVISTLLEASLREVEVRDSGGLTPLQRAARENRWDVVSTLTATPGAAPPVGDPIFISAVVAGARGAVSAMLKVGFDANQRSAPGYPALHEAALKNQSETLDLLIDAGADVNAQAAFDLTALMVASVRGQGRIVVRLLRAGARTDLVDHQRWTALHHATWGGHRSIAEVLMKSGADVKAQAVDGNTALHVAAMTGQAMLIHALVAGGSPLEARNGAGFTPLCEATVKAQIECIRALLAEGADATTVQGAEGMEVFWKAVADGQFAPVVAALSDV
jgi:ankyrin repeat protein